MTTTEELTPRQQQVLSAIVREYVATGQPVASKAVQEKHRLPVSTATIRNEMAQLTDQGYLSQPHTSAGRLPEEKAYRFHINTLTSAPLPPMPQVGWVRSQYRHMRPDVDTVMRTTTRILAQLTQRPALTMEHTHSQPHFTEVHTTPISARAIRISYECSDGSSQEVVIKSSQPMTAQQIRRLDQVLDERLRGTKVTETGPLLTLCERDDAPVPVSVLRSIAARLTSGWHSRVYVEGTAYILNYPEFQKQERLRGIIQTLNEEAAVQRLLHAIGQTSQVTVLIGSEHADPALADCSLVAKRFGSPPPDDNPSGTVGVLGPMRMPYGQIMSAVAYVADHADQVLSQQA